jgi:hypothetical protein
MESSTNLVTSMSSQIDSDKIDQMREQMEDNKILQDEIGKAICDTRHIG